MVADLSMARAIDPELRERIRGSKLKLPGLLVKGHSDIGLSCVLLLLYQAVGPFLSDDDAAELIGCGVAAVRRARRFLTESGVLAPQERVGLRWIKRVIYWPRRSSGPGDITVRVPGELLLDVLDGELTPTALRVQCLIVMDRIHLDDAPARCAYTVPEMCRLLHKGPDLVDAALEQLQDRGWLLRLPGYRNASTWVPVRCGEHTQPRSPAVSVVARCRGLLPSIPPRKGTLSQARKGTLFGRRRTTKAQVATGASRVPSRVRDEALRLELQGELPESVDSVPESMARLARVGRKGLAERILAKLGVSEIPVTS